MHRNPPLFLALVALFGIGAVAVLARIAFQAVTAPAAVGSALALIVGSMLLARAGEPQRIPA